MRRRPTSIATGGRRGVDRARRYVIALDVLKEIIESGELK